MYDALEFRPVVVTMIMQDFELNLLNRAMEVLHGLLMPS